MYGRHSLGPSLGILLVAVGFGCGGSGDSGPIVASGPAGSGGSSGTGGTPQPTVDCPALQGTAGLGSICGSTDAMTSSDGRYMFQNNIWNRAGGTQCIAPYEFGSYVGFQVASATHDIQEDAPAAYPSIVKGWHWGFRTQDHGMGRQLATVSSVPSLWCFATTTGDKYNVAYDIWLHPTNGDLGNTDPAGGMELMVWLHREDPANGVWPIGRAQDRFQYEGSWWTIYLEEGGTWTILSYMRETDISAVQVDLKYFFDDAIARGYLTSSWYLLGIEAGFEIWRGGTGLQSIAYQVDVL
ncbi:MAG: hypothetical protein JW751_15270 [Polyangiaceae bacterium]|nr:hypothetical protein [Polyangiaceae bacterium]